MRNTLKHDSQTMTTTVNLHAPCGAVRISVPTQLDANERIVFDSLRRTSFISVPSFATVIDFEVEVPEEYRWPELGDRKTVTLDVAYGGAFCESLFHSLTSFEASVSSPGRLEVHSTL